MKNWLSTAFIISLFVCTVCAQEAAVAEPETTGFVAEPFCKKGGVKYLVGESYVDAFESCKICECCKSGKFKCKPKVCANEQPPPCGKNHFDPISDECCPDCSSICGNTTCSTLSCPGTSMYPDDACCQVCACEFRGTTFPVGPITEKPVASCEQCTCNTDGTVTCLNEALCPAERLRCVDAEVLDDGTSCSWHCPNDGTCYRGDELIMPGQYKIVRDEICYCHDWHPIALCANLGHWGKIERILHQDRCLRMPVAPENWND